MKMSIKIYFYFALALLLPTLYFMMFYYTPVTALYFDGVGELSIFIFWVGCVILAFIFLGALMNIQEAIRGELGIVHGKQIFFLLLAEVLMIGFLYVQGYSKVDSELSPVGYSRLLKMVDYSEKTLEHYRGLEKGIPVTIKEFDSLLVTFDADMAEAAEREKAEMEELRKSLDMAVKVELLGYYSEK